MPEESQRDLRLKGKIPPNPRIPGKAVSPVLPNAEERKTPGLRQITTTRYKNKIQSGIAKRTKLCRRRVFTLC
jgi:hypothetical protein